MTVVLPIGYLTILQAAKILSATMYAGVPDPPDVARLREGGDEVRDGVAANRAIEEIWKAVDRGALRAMVIGGHPRRIISVDPEFTKSVPALRSSRGRGFSLLRPSNPAYQQLASWFGVSSLPAAVLGFRETEVQKLARSLMRRRRNTQKSKNQTSRRGRPSRIPEVQPVIKNLVDDGKWNPMMGLKALTRLVNRAGKWPKEASQETVTRALDVQCEQTKDRRFERARHTRKPRRKRA